MAENPIFIGRQYTPEYWDKHHQDDGCPVATTPLRELMRYRPQIEREQRLMRDRLTAELERYALMRGGSYVPLAKFEKGNTFVPNSYPHGTLIRIASEALNLGYLDQGEEAYSTCEEFGFVVDATGITIDGKNAILYVARRLIYGGSPEDIEIGAVRHSIRTESGSMFWDIASRVNRVEIVSMGSGFKQKVKELGKERRRFWGIPLPERASFILL